MTFRRLCIGMSVNACTRGLYTAQQPEVLDPADRTLQKGVGGPTGCTEAWATLVNSDDQVRARGDTAETPVEGGRQ